MFILKSDATYTWPVTLSLPKDGGVREKSSFDCTFRRLPQSRLRKLLADPENSVDLICKEAVVGWKGVKDDAGGDLPFSESALEAMLEVPTAAQTIATAYLESIAGAKTKN